MVSNDPKRYAYEEDETGYTVNFYDSYEEEIDDIEDEDGYTEEYVDAVGEINESYRTSE